MYRPLFFLFFVIALCAVFACTRKSSDYFRKQGQKITLELIQELQQIQELEDIAEKLSKLQMLFDQLVDVAIEAKKWQIKTKTTWQLDEEDKLLSQKLKLELTRLLQNPLMRHFLERSQESALERLDAFEKKLKRVSKKAPTG